MAAAWESAPLADQATPAWMAAPVEGASKPEPAKRGFVDQFVEDAKQTGLGAIRGAAGIGATLLAPTDALTGYKTRRADIESALKLLGADPENLGYSGGKLTAEIAGTAGVGGALGAGAKALKLSAPVVTALTTSGFKTGAVPVTAWQKAADLGLRTVTGATVGGASAALIDPEQAPAGAVIGGVLPGATKLIGAIGSKAAGLVSNAFKKGGPAGASAAIKAMGLQGQEAEILAALKSADEVVPGSRPTVAQALAGTDAGSRAAVLERVAAKSPGGSRLLDVYAAQNQARQDALEAIAPTNPLGHRQAQQELGEAVGRHAVSADAAARARTSALYESVPQDEAALYLPDLGPIRDKYYGPGVFTNREAADAAVATGRSIGTIDVAAGGAGGAGKGPLTLAQAVRKAGGLSITNNDGLRGELAGLRGDIKNIVRTSGGVSPARMAEKMKQAGYLADDDSTTLLNALRDESAGSPQYSMYDDIGAKYEASRLAAMGDAPGGQSVPVKVTLGDFEDLRSSIGQEKRNASRAGDAKMAKTLAAMEDALDARINEVVAGDGAIDEVLPIDWANKLSEARQAKVDQVRQFRTGPQAEIFRKGRDGQPLIQGGEVASKFWGVRPGLSDDVKSFRRLIDDNPEMLGQFKSMVTTEGKATQTKTGQELTTSFPSWLDQHITGLREIMSPKELQSLQNIAKDINRAQKAAFAGKGPGSTSDTFQLAANALDAGMLGSPVAKAAASVMPFSRFTTEPARQFLADSLARRKANDIAGFLSDSSGAANALEELLKGKTPSQRNALMKLLTNQNAVQFGYRAAPVLAAD